jgi:hypothetical protein
MILEPGLMPFILVQESFVLERAVPPAASHNAGSPSLSTFGAAPNQKEDADERQASYRQAWDSINNTVQVRLGALDNSALSGEKRMDILCLACSLL